MANDLTPLKQPVSPDAKFISNTYSELVKLISNLKDYIDKSSSKDDDVNKKDEKKLKVKEGAKLNDINDNPDNAAPYLADTITHANEGIINTLENINKTVNVSFKKVTDKKAELAKAKKPAQMVNFEKQAKAAATQKSEKSSVQLPKVIQGLKSSIDKASGVVNVVAHPIQSLEAAITKVGQFFKDKFIGMIIAPFRLVGNLIKSGISKVGTFFKSGLTKLFAAPLKLLSFNKNKDKKAVEPKAGGILVLASSVRNVPTYLAAYTRLVQTLNKSKPFSLSKLKKSQKSLDAFLTELDTDLAAQQKKFPNLEKNIKSTASIFHSLASIAKNEIALSVLSSLVPDAPEIINRPIRLMTNKKNGVIVYLDKYKPVDLKNADKSAKALSNVSKSLFDLAKNVAKLTVTSLLATVGAKTATLFVKNFVKTVSAIQTEGVKEKKKSILDLQIIANALQSIELKAIVLGALAIPATTGVLLVSLFNTTTRLMLSAIPKSDGVKDKEKSISAVARVMSSLVKMELQASLLAATGIPAILGVSLAIAFSALLRGLVSALPSQKVSKNTESLVNALSQTLLSLQLLELQASLLAITSIPAILGVSLTIAFSALLQKLALALPSQKISKDTKSSIDALSQIFPSLLLLESRAVLLAVTGIPAILGISLALAFTKILQLTLKAMPEAKLADSASKSIISLRQTMLSLLQALSLAALLAVPAALAVASLIAASVAMLVLKVAASLTELAGKAAKKANAQVDNLVKFVGLQSALALQLANLLPATILAAVSAVMLIALNTMLITALGLAFIVGTLATVLFRPMKTLGTVIAAIRRSVLQRMDAEMIRMLSVSIVAATMLVVFATILSLAMFLLTAAALLAIPALVGLVAFGAFLVALIFLGKLAMKSLLSLVVVVLASLAILAVGAAMAFAMKKMAEAGQTILDNIPQILTALGAFALMLLGMTALSLIAIPALIGIAIVVAASLAVLLVAVSIEKAVKSLIKIGETDTSKIYGKDGALDKIKELFKAFGFGLMLVAAKAAVTLVAILPASLLLLAVSVPLSKGIEIFARKMKIEDIDAANAILAGPLQSFFMSLGELMGPALASMIASAAILVAAVLLLPALGALAVDVTILNKISSESVFNATAIVQAMAPFFLSLAATGLAALVAVVPLAFFLAASVLLLPASLAMLAAITAFNKITLKMIGHAAAVSAVMLLLFTELSAIGLISIFALPGLTVFAAVGGLLKKATGIETFISKMAKLDSQTLKKAMNAVSSLGKIFTSIKDAGKAAKGIKGSIKQIKNAEKHLDDIVALFDVFKNLKMPDNMSTDKVKDLASSLEALSLVFTSVSEMGNAKIKNIKKIKENIISIVDMVNSIQFENSSSSLDSSIDTLNKGIDALSSIDIDAVNRLSKLKVKNDIGTKLSSLATSLSSVASTDSAIVAGSKNLSDAINNISDTNFAGLSLSMKSLMKSFDKTDKTAKSIDKLSKSMHGLNEELQKLNDNSNAVKSMNNLNASVNVQENRTIVDKKGKGLAANSANQANSEAAILEKIESTLDNFFKSYEDKNKTSKPGLFSQR